MKCTSKDPADVNNDKSTAISTALSKVLEQVLLTRVARYLGVADSQFGFKQAHGTEIMHIFTQANCVFHRNLDTHVHVCFLDANNAFDRVNHWTLAKKLLDRDVPLHIVKFFIIWYREQEFMYDGVTHYQWHSDFQMGSGKGDSCHHCCIMYIQMT